MRASTAITPSGLAKSGLISSLVILGNSQTKSETRSRTSTIAARSIRCISRKVSKRRDIRVDSIIRRANTSFSGGRLTARSPSKSNICPSTPKKIKGPKIGSLLTPKITSRASAPATICSTVTPLISASGRAARAFSTILRKASLASAAFMIPVRTPPTSVFWII